MYQVIRRLLRRINDWHPYSFLMKKWDRERPLSNADSCLGKISFIHIRKKLGNAKPYFKSLIQFILPYYKFGKEWVDRVGRTGFARLIVLWEELRKVKSWRKPKSDAGSHSNTSEIKSTTLLNGHLRLLTNIAFLAAGILFMSGLVFWTRRNILSFEKETVTKVNQYMSDVAREKAQCIEQSVQDIQEYCSLLAKKPFSGEFKQGQPVRYKDYAAGEAVLEHVGGKVDSIYRINSKGMVLHRVPDKKSSIGKDFSEMPGIKPVLENREPSVSEVFPLYSGKLGFCICHPVFDNDTFMGAICIMISLETLNKSTCTLQTASPGLMWVINHDGLIISHANPDFIGENILEVEMKDSTDSDRGEFDEIIGKMMSGQEGHGVYRSMVRSEEKTAPVKKAVAFLPVTLSNQGWSIAITMDYAEIADPVKRNTRNDFLVAAFMMLVFGFVGSIFYRNQKKKAELELIARSAEELRASNENLRLEIEQRIQAEEAQEKSENSYRLLAENVTDIIWMADLNLRLTYISPSVERVLGIHPSEATGHAIEEALTPASLDSARQAFAEEFAVEKQGRRDHSRARTLDLELRRNDGSCIWAETKVSFLYDSAGKPAGLLGVTRDITEKRQLQHQFYQAQKMESIGTLAGGIAHDFNNIISGIVGYASLLKMKMNGDPDIFRYAETIEKSASRAGDFTTQLLAFARGGKYEPKVVDLNKIVGETLELIDRTFDKSIDIEVHLQDSIPTVEADAGQMQQVLMNLCVNARDAMEGKGKLTIETNEETLAVDEAVQQAVPQSGSYVVLSVSDTGTGMDEETKNRIFEPFFTTKEKGKGTGLGLAMVYGVTQHHGGHVRVLSEPSKGSTFKIYIPASGKPVTRELSRGRIARGKNEQILVVDDEEVSRSLAKDALEYNGYRVIAAKDGVEAIQMYEELKGGLNLVIFDLEMPRMGGRETFLKLKEIDQGVRAILLTGHADNDEVDEILRSGVMGFIRKPFQLTEFLGEVRSVLDSKMTTPA